MASTDDYDIRRFTRAAKGKNGLITIFTVELFSWDFSWIGIFSTDHGALRSGEFFSVVSFSQVGFPPLISVLSDRGSVHNFCASGWTQAHANTCANTGANTHTQPHQNKHPQPPPPHQKSKDG